MASQKYVLPISLQQLLATYTDHEHSFICYAAENIVSEELDDDVFGYIDSFFFWAELHRLDPEIFCRPIDISQEPSAIIDQWINRECFGKFPFIQQYVVGKSLPGSFHAFRKQLLALLVERHGPDTEIPFKFTKG
jgi:hypothetical protein